MKLSIPKPDLSALVGRIKGLREKLPARFGGGDSAAPQTGAPEADDDIPDHLKPTWFQRNQHLLPVLGVAGFLLISFAALGTYLALNADAIEEEVAALTPMTEVTEFTRPPAATGSGEGDSAGSATSETVGTSDGSANDGSGATAPADDDADGPDAYAGNLAPHPDPGLVEEIENLGLVPRVGSDGRVPWRVYARPSSTLETRPRVAVVVLNLGLSVQATEAAIALPGAVTLSFSPYAPGLEDWISQARDAGHEVMIGLPMEPRDFPRSDAGILSLMTTVEAEQNIVNLQRVMSEGSGYIGVANYQGSGFTSSRAAVQPVVEALANRGLVYFDTLENATSVVPEEAEKIGLPHATADLLLGQSQSRSIVLARLNQFELLAKTQETGVVAVEAYPMLLDRIRSWARDLRDRDLVLTPLSGVIAARIRQE